MKLSKILVLLAVIAGLFFIYQRASQNGFGFFKPPITDTVYKSDTLWQIHDTVITKKLIVKQVIHDTLPPQMIPNPMYDSLVVQYQELADDYLARRIYKDTINIDSIGYVAVADTVKNNTLLNRSYASHYKIPVVKDTVNVIKYLDPVREVYFGGGVSANKTTLGNVHVGVLYKDRKDRLYGTYISAGMNGKITYGVQTYLKISHKN